MANIGRVSPEILAAQAEYAARPFAIYWCDSHFRGASRFHTLDGAYEYLQDMWARIQRVVRTTPCRESLLRWGYLETPEGRMPLRYVLLCDDVSSYGSTWRAQA